jgi:5-enolpyruvylshikimate-3-phosphate synthase
MVVAGLVSEIGVKIKGVECINTSFPGFFEVLEGLIL